METSVAAAAAASASASTPVATAANEKVDTAAVVAPAAVKGKCLLKSPEEFYKDLQQFHERRGTPIMQMPKISGRIVDLYALYNEVTERGGFPKVNSRDEWDEVLPIMGLPERCVNASAALKHIYRRCLEKYERLNFFGEDPDKFEALEAIADLGEGGRSRVRYPSTMHCSFAGVNAVPMSYNYRQHIVNMDRRRMYHLSTDLHKPSPYEKLMLSLISPLPNEQDFGINVCTLMTNESKHTLKLNEYPKLLDVLLAHAGVFRDYTMRKLFHHMYTEIRQHSLFCFWRDLLHDKPQILELYTDETTLREAGLLTHDKVDSEKTPFMEDCLSMDFLNLGRCSGTQDYVGQRVLQVVNILRNLSFFEENLPVFAKNRTFLRFIIMSANTRWGNIHMQALDIAGNMANEMELCDPTTDDLSRCLMATLCDGIESSDRGVIINCLEILYKLCQKENNEEYINKCLNANFYQTLCLFLSLNDIMLLIFTLEAIYALTSTGARSCHLLMQVRGIVDQLVSLISVEVQSYGPDGCILMRVVETVPGNMLPLVAQNIANLQNVAVIHKQQQQQQVQSSVYGSQPQLHDSQIPQPQVPIFLDDMSVPLQQRQQPQAQPLINSYQQPQQQQPQPQLQLQPQPAQSSQLQMPQNYTQEDEQYALSWLGATFERAATVDSHVEQQELYRMYLSHCQKFGKHSVVNHLQFPKLVRLIFSNGVGPVVVRRTDGTELPGFRYVQIRLRAQPLPIQIKQSPAIQRGGDGKLPKGESNVVGRKLKKKQKLQSEVSSPTQQKQELQKILPVAETASVGGDIRKDTMVLNKAASESTGESTKMEVTTETVTASTTTALSLQRQSSSKEQTTVATSADDVAIKTEQSSNPSIQLPVQQKVTIASSLTSSTAAISNVGIQNAPHVQQELPTQPQQPSSSLIKCLLANKVTQRQQKQKELTIAATSQTNTPTSVLSTSGSSLPQSQMKTQQQQQQQQQPIKVTSTAISALVNNPLLQNTPVKVGQTTIKPLNPQVALDKKPHVDSVPPPLAPLSGSNVAKDSSGRPVIIANQMLVEILDKVTGDPPIPATIIKRKIEDVNTEPVKRVALDNSTLSVVPKEDGQVTPSKNAANLYAEMAASILEDEDLEDIPPMPVPTTTAAEQVQQQHQPLMIPAKIQQTSLQNVQRQLLFQANQSPQLKLTTHSNTTSQLPTAMATIKTDQGLQTVPVILQQKTIEQSQPQLIQQVLHQGSSQAATQQTTQYVLATNQQGQTYLVAQQSQPPPPPPPPTQTVLVTQMGQQQSTGTKTIIILQQQSLSPVQQQQPSQLISSGGSGPQKMIMTTPQGQQVLVTQRAQSNLSGQTPQQIFINPQTGAATHIHHMPISGTNTTASNLLQRQLIQTTQHQQQSSQQHQTGHISPSLLSQLNHIPATIKLHQPQVPSTTVQQHQPATISRLTKSVSIVQTPPPPPPPPIQIPQLQQHQSIIQQHIISGPTEKRQVMIGGRAIEIKETVITQTAPPLQQSQLNSQTIITKQPHVQQAATSSAMAVQKQQQQQQIRTVIEHQQQHQSIIQQKITLPLQQGQGQPSQTLITSKIAEHSTGAQAALLTKSQTAGQATLSQAASTAMSVKKPLVHQAVSHGKPLPQLPHVQTTPQIKSNEPPPLVVSTSINQTHTGSTVTSVATTTATSNVQTVQAVLQEIPRLAVTTGDVLTSGTTATAATPTTSTTAAIATTTPTPILPATSTPPPTPSPSTPTSVLTPSSTISTQPQSLNIEANWLYVCDWRNCPRRKFKSVNDLQHHACTVHCPDHLDPAAEIFCQWGVGPGLCDGVPRKRYSLMTHIIDRHLTTDSLRMAMQRRIATGTVNVQPTQPPVTIVRNVDQSQRSSTSSPALSTSSSGSQRSTSSSAMQAIKRYTADFVNPKELMDENEGPVTKSIRLTAALILRNLVTYTNTAKRSLQRYEPHLANIALSNMESSGAISHILFELNN